MSLQKAEIMRALNNLDEELRRMGVKAELCLYGGAVMALVFDARPSTKDVDAVFRPAREVRDAAARVAEANGLGEDWLNDAVKGFVVPHEERLFLDLPNLRVFVPEPDYLLAMKVLAARVDTADAEDVRRLIRQLGLTAPEEVFVILRKYYPDERIRPATQFFIEEIFGQ